MVLNSNAIIIFYYINHSDFSSAVCSISLLLFDLSSSLSTLPYLTLQPRQGEKCLGTFKDVIFSQFPYKK